MAGATPEEAVPVAANIQSWRLVTMVHWPCDPAALASFVPAPLELDLFDGQAWVSLTPFCVSGFRPPLLPSLPRLSTFPETNLRTYVRLPDGRDGLWFLTLEVNSPLTAVLARAAYGVPYRLARMTVEHGDGIVRYRSRRLAPSGPRPHHDITVHPLGPLPAGDAGALDHWLTGRWRAFGRPLGRLVTAAVRHEPWPLWRVELEHLDEDLTASMGLAPPGGPPLVHFSPGVDARLGLPTPVGGSGGN